MDPEVRSSSNVVAAIAEWKAILGEAWVDDAVAARARLEEATFLVTGRVLAHLRPGTVDEVAACLRAAARHGVSINVLSRGRNYGYSSGGPAAGATAAMELSRLSAISDFDEELGTLRVQAGVTFAQVVEYLESRGARRYLPATGGPADGSVLANTVERGHGLGYGGDRYANACRYEVVTARGERLETGFGRFEGSRIADLMRPGVGPSLDGLFTQSSLGVVTAATLWLPRRPKHWTSFLVPTPAPDRIGALFACVGEAARQGLVRDGAAYALSSHKLATLMTRREEFETPAGRAVSFEDLRQHSVRWGHAAWLLGFLVDAETEEMLAAKEAAAAAIFRPALLGEEPLVALNARRGGVEQAAEKILPGAPAPMLRMLVDVYHERPPQLGFAIQDPLRTVYWRSRPVTGELHADGIGLVWVSVVVPMRAAEIAGVCSRIDDGLLAHGFEPSTQVTMVSERLIRVITALTYDRSQPGADERAVRCQEEVYADLRQRGYYTYRLQPHLMEEYGAYGADHQAVVQRIKEALDPHGVLDPSRYPGAR